MLCLAWKTLRKQSPHRMQTTNKLVRGWSRFKPFFFDSCFRKPLQFQFRTRNGFATVLRSSVSEEVLSCPAFFFNAQFDYWLTGARGVSLLFAAGNGGVGDWGLENQTEHLCFSNDGRNVTKFLPGKHRLSFLPFLLILISDTIYSFPRLMSLVSYFASTGRSRSVTGVVISLLDV